MSSYQIVVASRAKRDLKKINQVQLTRLDEAILKLEETPYPHGVKRLIAADVAQYRIRVGDYRILYDVDEKSKTVIILRVGHRKEIYR
jgi:mRNA interferase RelE/StbE